ncbi:hypothetical protein MIND_00791200 [Mycena indigotica]|uniref:Protein kinase domain-containing protein n=1 Tax=Mycena indigotica TaxID=2126181 RepID=A0A8H6SNW9_9AGAR|nr:uncharacterized protein MIND_00791200 [Mycena indigotica]KAF7302242.1 hypothetical protein MIND_00791200 [Mycena indigotica]
MEVATLDMRKICRTCATGGDCFGGIAAFALPVQVLSPAPTLKGSSFNSTIPPIVSQKNYPSRQVVVAELQSGPASFPPRFVLKFSDPRFIPNRLSFMKELDSERNSSPWSPRFREFFISHLRDFRTKSWPNYWKCTGATHPITDDERYQIEEEFYDDYLCDREGTLFLWSQEMYHWEATFDSHFNELAVYQALRPLQGRHIPRLFGRGTFKPPSDGFDDPLLSSVPFLALEHIPGATLNRIQLLSTRNNSSPTPQITNHDATCASHVLIDVVRAIRNLGVNNPDYAARNIVLRNLDPLCPVIIDFGLASTKQGLASDLQDIRDVLYDIKWNIPSPYRRGVETPLPLSGFAPLNRAASGLSDRKRDVLQAYFEEIVPGPSRTILDGDGTQHIWEASRWRLKEGVRTCDEDVEWGLSQEAIESECQTYLFQMRTSSST